MRWEHILPPSFPAHQRNDSMPVKKFLRSCLRSTLNLLTPKTQVYPNVITLSPNSLLEGRNALITGGTSGIGYSIAKAFASAGASVIITGRSEDRIAKAVLKLKEETSSNLIGGILLDNRKVDDFKNSLDKAESIFKKRIDILVNNAGVLGCDFSTGDESTYDMVMDTNLKGAFFLSQNVAHYMVERNVKGNILNVGSSSCLRPAASAYTISKWGLRGLTMGMARLLAPKGITVNGIAPGPTATPMLMQNESNRDMFFSNPLGRYILPEEIANMAVILVSDLSRAVIGDIVYMTGGSGVVTYDDVNYKFE